MSELLTATDVAAQLKVSLSKAYAMKHEIGYVEVGGNVRFEQEAVDAYKQRCKRGPQTKRVRGWELKSDIGKTKRSGSSPREVTASDVSARLRQKKKQGLMPPSRSLN